VSMLWESPTTSRRTGLVGVDVVPQRSGRRQRWLSGRRVCSQARMKAAESPARGDERLGERGGEEMVVARPSGSEGVDMTTSILRHFGRQGRQSPARVRWRSPRVPTTVVVVGPRHATRVPLGGSSPLPRAPAPPQFRGPPQIGGPTAAPDACRGALPPAVVSAGLGSARQRGGHGACSGNPDRCRGPFTGGRRHAGYRGKWVSAEPKARNRANTWEYCKVEQRRIGRQSLRTPQRATGAVTKTCSWT
jgi:hypothetical protein